MKISEALSFHLSFLALMSFGAFFMLRDHEQAAGWCIGVALILVVFGKPPHNDTD